MDRGRETLKTLQLYLDLQPVYCPTMASTGRLSAAGDACRWSFLWMGLVAIAIGLYNSGKVADKGRNDMSGIFASIGKKIKGIIRENAVTALSDSRTSNDVNRHNIVGQLIDFCMSNSIEAPIAAIPYDPSSVVDLEATRTAVSAEKYQIDLAICKKSKIIFYNSKRIKSLVDEGSLSRHENDWATFLSIVYDCGLKVSLVDTVSGKLIPFQKDSG